MVTPTSQKAGERPISFHLLDDDVNLDSLYLVVRPEDLTRAEPTRMALHQTLDTERQGWLDDFGVGLPTINISGHTGWRGNADGDGVAQFERLNALLMVNRPAAIQNKIGYGQDPSKVRLVFADRLDNFCYNVVPQNFVLRRSKSRPLLMQYQIALQVVSRSVDPYPPFEVPPSADGQAELGLDSLGEALKTITEYAQTIASAIAGTIGKLAAGFLAMTAKILGVVSRVMGALKGAVDLVTGSFLAVARDILQAGRNLFMTIQSIMSFPAYIKQRLSQIASTLNAAACVIKNVFKVRKTLPNYDDWYGASTCSSTAGGAPLSPLRHTNPFYLLSSPATPPIVMTPQATAAIRTAAANDPVLAPVSLSDASRMMGDIAAGVAVA